MRTPTPGATFAFPFLGGVSLVVLLVQRGVPDPDSNLLNTANCLEQASGFGLSSTQSRSAHIVVQMPRQEGSASTLAHQADTGWDE
jgi:hypothetical protein